MAEAQAQDTLYSPYSFHDTWVNLVAWSHEYFMTPSTLSQLAIILSAFCISAVVYRVARKHIASAIDRAEMPLRVKRTLNNAYRLILPVVALVLIFFASQVERSEIMKMDTSLSEGVMKVLLAWIVIRMAVQFINNSLVRNLFSTAILVIAALSIFGVLDETAVTLDAIGFSFGKFRFSALAVIKGILSLFILLYMAAFASSFLERRVLKSRSLTRSSQVLIVKVLRVVLIVIAIVIGVTSAGIDLSIFAVFSGAVGLGVGFGLQKVISNLFSGMLLLMDKSITPGDIIQLEQTGTFGWVNHMAARYTEIVTRDNKSYLIPNEDFITQRVVNWSHGNRLIRLEVKFGVHYDSDPRFVMEIAKQAAASPLRVIDTPEPVCWLESFGDNAINFSLRFWIKDAEQGVTNVKGEVLLALWDAFKEQNIQIPYPHREIYMHHINDPPPRS